MDLVVAYDVNTTTRAGERRLRRVARVCESFGQRVQFSVFEVTCSRTEYVRMIKELADVVVPDEDSLRIYAIDPRLLDGVFTLGLQHALPADEPWSL